MTSISLGSRLLAVSLATLVVAAQAFAGSGTVTVNFLKSDNTTGVAGGIVEYYKSGWQPLGTTDGSGTASGSVVLTGNTTDFRLRWYGGTKNWGGVDVTANPTLSANTTPVTVALETCAGAPLVGKAYWNAGSAWGGYNLIGLTPSGTELLPGSYTFRINYSAHNGANASFNNTKNQDIGVNSMVVFNTTKVTLYGGTITYYENNPTGGWVPFVNPSEMLPGTVSSFKFNGVPQTLAISGCAVTGAMLRVIDEFGQGVAGGKAQPAIGGSWQPVLSGATNANGYLLALLPTGYTKIKMSVNQSSQEKSTAQLVTDNFTWQTGTATINVKNAAGGPLAGAVIDQGGGFWDLNKAVTDANGLAKVPMFAGSGKFRANWNNTAQVISQAVPSTFMFQTGVVHSLSGNCTQWNGAGWIAFVQDMEVFPGNYTFKFNDLFPQTSYGILGGTINNIH